MKNKQATFISVTLAFMLILVFSSQSLAGETYKIGFSGALTGTTSDVGVPYSKAIEDYCRYVNDEKLLGDDRLECLIRDDGYEIDDIEIEPPFWIDDNSSAYKPGMTVHTDFKALEKDIRAYIEDELTELGCTYADEEQNMDFEGTISLHIEFTKTDEKLIISGIWKQDE